MARVIAEELEIHGSHGMAARDYPAMLELVATGALRPERLIGAVIGLDGAPAAMAAMGGPGADGITVIGPAVPCRRRSYDQRPLPPGSRARLTIAPPECPRPRRPKRATAPLIGMGLLGLSRPAEGRHVPPRVSALRAQ